MANHAIRNRANTSDARRDSSARARGQSVPGLVDIAGGNEAPAAAGTQQARSNPERDEPRSAPRGKPGRPPVGSADKRMESERRSPDRAVPRNGRLVNASRAHDAPMAEHQFYMPRDQRGMAQFILLSFVLAAGVARSVPDVTALIAAALSVGLLFGGSQMARFERRVGVPKFARLMLLLLGIVTPMALAGYAFASWIEAGLAWQWATATLICITAAAASLFKARTLSLFAAKIAIWASFAMAYPSLVMVTAVTGSVLTLAIIARLEWKAAEQNRIDSEARERVAARAEDILRSFEESGQGWFWETDRRGAISYISPSAAQVLGRSPHELVGEPLSSIVDPDGGAAEGERTISFHLSARSAFRDIEVLAANQSEGRRHWSLTGRPVYDSYKNFCGFRGHGTDLTEKRRSEQQVTRLAHFDSLTGLANRLQMSEALEQILGSPRERDRACTVLMLDLDRFKQVNDTMGHPAGDALLKQVAQRLDRVVGKYGRCGRLGGDEFEVIVPGQGDREILGQIAKEIINTLSQPYSIEGQSVVIGASVGIALAPDDGTTSEALIRNVDLALYAAKDAGRGVHRFYSADLHSAAEERAELEQDLREAIRTGGLSLYYQPVVNAASEKVAGFEALMRWKHPKRGFISPDKFVPIAEDAGLIDQMGQWALRTACADLARWPTSIRCAVNVSPLQFANPELANHVANALAHSGVDPARLELEITESVFLGDSSGTDAMFRALKRVGVRLALDDFGTGYSSLGYLKKAPFDKIKIDQSFVRGATEKGSRNGAIITSITSLAEALNMDTTAEGVETIDELELVRLLGCSHIQGYIYYAPLDAEEATRLVEGDLTVQAEGPSSARTPRFGLLRRVTVVHKNNRLSANIRNISEGGAMIEGLWNMPEGSRMRIEFTADRYVDAKVRWSRENRIGVEFEDPLRRSSDGTFSVLRGQTRQAAVAAR